MKNFHPRNTHNQDYDFDELKQAMPELDQFVEINKYGNQSINYFKPEAVKALNRALLKVHYNIPDWNIPDDFLCPPIPGRVDYIHHLADLIKPSGKEIIRCLDIGTGANCIYPLLGTSVYNWHFVATESNDASLAAAKENLRNNPELGNKIQLRKQYHKKKVFKGVVKKTEFFHLSMCNPPFHASAKEAHSAGLKKLRNLKKSREVSAKPNFGGQSNELWFPGGEYSFIKNMIQESIDLPNIKWFSCLVSKKETLNALLKLLADLKAESSVIPLNHGNKISRILAWKFERD